MGFFSRRKKKDMPPAAPEADCPVTLLAEGGRYVRELLIALPPAAQAILPEPEEAAAAFPHLKTEATDARPCGNYVLFADAFCRPCEQAVEFFRSLAERNEDVIVFPLRRQKYPHPDPSQIPSFFEDASVYRLFGCAVSLGLYGRLAKSSRLPQPFLFAPSLTAETFFFSDLSPFYRTALPAPTAENLRALLSFFTEIKGTLNAPQYKYGFDFLCAKIVQAYALLAHRKDCNGLKELDEYLKSDCMALRVAAVRRAPFGFIERLSRRGFETTPAAAAGIAWTLFKEKTK